MNNPKDQEREFPLTSDRGFINIGNHPSNDIVIDGEHVQPFHAMIDCRQEPFLLLPLSPDSEMWVNDASVSGRQAVALHEGETIQLSSHNLKLSPRSNGNPPSLTVTNTLATSGVIDEGYRQSAAQPAQLPTLAIVHSKPGEDIHDEYIVASLLESSATIDVEQTAYYNLTIANGSTIVSTFNIQVEGVPDEWVMVTPQNVNLNEGGRAEVTISITPPRKPTSAAGMHALRLMIASFNHPGRQTIIHACLEINPFYDYVIGEIVPGRKKIAYTQPSGEVKMQVANRGNSSAAFVLTARDEEEACRFQFNGEDGLKQTGQVQLTLPAGETRQVPVYVSPIKRRIIGWKSPQYPFRVAVSQPQSAAQSLFTLGTAIARPLIGILGILILILCVMALIGYAFTPRITTFTADDNAVSVGGSTTLHWKVPVFTHDLQITGMDEPKTLNNAQGSLLVYPTKTVNSYTLNATTWLWHLLGLKPMTRSFTVLSVPSEPLVNTFTLSKTDNVLFGDQVQLRWSVDNATKAQMTINGVTEVLEDKAGFNGEKPILVTKDTLVYLEAFNALSSTAKSLFFKANPPEININRFEASGKTVYKGSPVTIYWDVTGAGMDQGGVVTISGFDGVLPNTGELTFFPEQSMEFVLSATNRTLRETRILPIGVLDPEAPPPMPVITFFTAAPDTIVGPGNVELSWSVSGIFDNIKILNGSEVVDNNLNAQGFRTIKVSTSGTYVMTATQKDKSVGANLKITVNPAMKKPVLKVTGIFPSAPLQMGDQSTISISIGKPAKADPPPTGTVIVTDGTASCTITLPKTSCDLLFQTAGLKSIVANYQGDSVYLSAESTYASAVDVGGITSTLVTVLRNPNQTDNSKFEYGERLDLAVSLQGIKTNFKPNGFIRISKYICDANKENCVYAPDQPSEALHQFSPQENGVYTFVGLLPLDKMVGSIELLIDFDSDSFYNRSSSTQYVTIDPSTKSPVTITAEQPTAGVTTYNVTVTDENIFGFYTAPQGTISITATHTDGTRVSCAPVALVANIDNRTSSAACSFSATKRGAWSLSAAYDPGADVSHFSQVSPIGSISTTADVYVALAADSPPLYVGVNSQMKVNVTDGLGATITRGTLIYTYNSVTSSCTAVGNSWVCSAIKPVEDITQPITFGFTPDITDQNFISPQSLLLLNQISQSGTAVGPLSNINAPATVPPFLPGQQYEFRTVVTSLQMGGDPPLTGSVTVKLVDSTGTCADVSTREFSLPLGKSGVADGFIIFSDTDDGKMVCYQFDGNSGYLPSPQTSADIFTIRKLATGISNFRAITPPITPPPYIPGLDYEFRANVSNAEPSGGTAPADGFVTVKLVNSTTSCLVDSDRQFSLVVGAAGVADGMITFVSDDSDNNKLCYRYDGNATFAESAWGDVTLPIRKLNTTVGYFTAINTVETTPPFLPSVNYTLKTTVSDEKGTALSSGTVAVKLVAASQTCDDASDRKFSLIVETGGEAKGDYTFLNSDSGSLVCYRYEGDTMHNQSPWKSVSLDVEGINTTVNSLKTVSPAIATPPYIPGVNYQFSAKVVREKGGIGPTSGTIAMKIISGTDCDTAATEEFSLSVGDGGVATGDITFPETAIGVQTACYQFTGLSYYNPSPWAAMSLDIRKLSSSVAGLKAVNASPTPPPYIPAVNYQFQATVTGERGIKVTSGSVAIKLIDGTDCATATSVHDFTLPVADTGLATGTLTFLDADIGGRTACYQYLGTDNFNPSDWVTIGLEVRRLTTTVSDLKVLNATVAPPPYIPGMIYHFQARVVAEAGSAPEQGTITMKVISGTDCTNTSSTSTYSLSVGSGGVATGDVTLLDADTGTKTACYRFGQTGSWNLSPWQSISLVIRKLNTSIANITLSGGTAFPPSGGIKLGTSYTFITTVSESDGKGTTIPVGSTVSMDLIASTDSCGASSLITPITLTVGAAGLATSPGYTFPDTLSGTYVFCGRYTGDTNYAPSSYWKSSSFTIAKRATIVSALAVTPSTSVFVVGTAYTFSAAVADDEGGTTPPTPTGGTVNLYLVPSTVTSYSACTTNTPIGTIAVTNGVASGSVTFVDSMVSGSQNKICYKYSGAGQHGASPMVLYTSAFNIKRQPSFTAVPSATSLVSAEDATVSANQTSLAVTLKNIKDIDSSKLKLVDGSGNTVCIGNADTTSTGHYVCKQATYTTSTSGGFDWVTATWKIGFNDAESLTLTPTFDGDTKNLEVDGTAFTVRSRYSLTWISNTMTWTPVASTTLVAYINGEPDQMTTTFSGVFKFDKFTSHTYTTTDFTGSVAVGTSQSGTIDPAGTCTLTTVNSTSYGNGLQVTCSGVGLTDARDTKVKLAATPTGTADDYTGSLNSPDITSIDVKGNVTEAGGGPTVRLGCTPLDADNKSYVKFHVKGKASVASTTFLDSMSKIWVVMGCEKNNDDANSWNIFRPAVDIQFRWLDGTIHTLTVKSTADYSNETYDPSTGNFSLDITANSNATNPDGCGFHANKLRVGLYYGYVPQDDHTTGVGEPAIAVTSFEPQDGTIDDYQVYDYEYFYDIGPDILPGFPDGDNWRDCPEGLNVDFAQTDW